MQLTETERRGGASRMGRPGLLKYRCLGTGVPASALAVLSALLLTGCSESLPSLPKLTK